MRCNRHATPPKHIKICNNEPCQVLEPTEVSPKITIKKKLNINNREIKLKTQLSIANREVTFLVDTGATVTLLSAKVIKRGTIYYPSKSVNLVGINGENNKLKSLGLVYGSINIDNYKLKHKFQIVDGSVNLDVDGILGYDFLSAYGAKIDLMNDTLELTLPPENEAYETLFEEIERNKIRDKQENKIENKIENKKEEKQEEKRLEVQLISTESSDDESDEDYEGKYDNYYQYIENLFLHKPDKTQKKEVVTVMDIPKEGETRIGTKKVKNKNYYETETVPMTREKINTDQKEPQQKDNQSKMEKINAKMQTIRNRQTIVDLKNRIKNLREVTDINELNELKMAPGAVEAIALSQTPRKITVSYKRTNQNIQVCEKISKEQEVLVLLFLKNNNQEEVKLDVELLKEKLGYKGWEKTTNRRNTDGKVVLPPKTMRILRIKTEQEYQICKAKQFSKDVFLIDGLIQAKNGFANVAIFNTGKSRRTFKTKDLGIEMEDINQYDAYETEPVEIKDPQGRIEYLKENLKNDHWNQKERQIMNRLIEQHHQAFYIDGDKNTFTDVTAHDIVLKPGARPIFTPQYRIPQSQRPLLQEHIEQLIKNDVVEESTSPWNSPIMLVPKKGIANGKKQQRLVVDFRRLNEVSETETFPIPDFEEEITKMAGSKVFSTLDLNAAYHQIPLTMKARELTSFQTSTQKLQFKRMPFGLKGSPITWQRTINLVLSGIQNIMCYVDDIIAYSGSIEEHAKLLEKLLTTLQKHRLKLKVQKSIFFCKEVEYLGHVINEDGVKANPKKVECIKQFPRPRDMVEVQRFLGMCNYYRKYVPNYSKITKPLHVLCKKDIPFVWSQKCEEAFQDLKNRLTKAPILAFPDFTETFYVTTDASEYAVGAVLSQGDWPNDRPIQYFSKTLGQAQQNYAVIHKEMLSIILAIEQFRHYLYGREFVVVTDHKPLTSLFKQTKLSNRLLRWKLMLSEYDFKIIHVPGKQNTVADCLSRIKPDIISTPKSIEELMKETTNEEILPVTTRSKSKTKAQLQQQQTGTKEEFRNTYHFEEGNNILINISNYDNAFYLFRLDKPAMKAKLEDKIKKKITLEAETGELQDIGDKRCIITVPGELNTTDAMETMKRAIKIIRMYSETRRFERIAVNIDLREGSSHLLFKDLYREIFKGSQINTTIFLNKVIDIHKREEIAKILETYHNSPLGGHMGVARMKNSIRRFYNWPNMTQDIKDYIRDCSICERAKIQRHTRMPMEIKSTASEPFEKVYVDFVGPINPPSTLGHRYIFTCSCELTKYAVAIPTFDCTALTAAVALVRNVCLVFNIPKTVVSDNGTAFTSKIYQETSELLKMKTSFITPYHPQSNAVERYHKTLGQYLRTYTEEEPGNWSEYLTYATFSYNNTVNITTGHSPHMLVFGFEIKLPIEVTEERLSYNYDTYKRELQLQLRKTQKLAKQAITDMKWTNKNQYDKKTKPIKLQKNDLVLLLNENKETKFAMPYLGPFRVEKTLSDTVTIIRKNGKSVRVHNNKLILAKASYGSRTPPEIE